MEIPIIYYPLTILCLDDEDIMLRTLTNYISPKYPVITASSSQSAESLLLQSPQGFLSSYLKKIINNNDNDSTEIQLNIRLEQLSGLLEIPERMNEIGVMVVDYMLPDSNGLELCQKYHESPIQKFLFTGFQDNQKVLDAYRTRDIQSFLPKTHPNLFHELLTNLSQLTTDFFLKATQQLRANIEIKNVLPITDDYLFKDFFKNTINNMEIRHWCLIDTVGSFLFLNSKAEFLYFVIHTEDSLDSFTKLYNENDFQIFIEPIKNRLKIPFFGANTDPTDVDVSEWGNYMYKPQKFIGKKIYYWNIIKREV